MPTASPATETAPLANSFETLDDSRDGETYPLGEIVVLVVCAAISGADTFVAVGEFGDSRLDWLHGLLPFEDGIPSHFRVQPGFWSNRPGAVRGTFLDTSAGSLRAD